MEIIEEENLGRDDLQASESDDLDLDLGILEIDEDGEDSNIWAKNLSVESENKEKASEEIEDAFSIPSKEEYTNELETYANHNHQDEQAEDLELGNAQREEDNNGGMEDVIFDESFDDVLDDTNIFSDQTEDSFNLDPLNIEQEEDRTSESKQDIALDLQADIEIATDFPEDFDAVPSSEGQDPEEGEGLEEGEIAFSQEELANVFDGGTSDEAKDETKDDFSFDVDTLENEEASSEPILSDTSADIMDDDSALAETASVLVENEINETPIALTNEELGNIASEAGKEDITGQGASSSFFASPSQEIDKGIESMNDSLDMLPEEEELGQIDLEDTPPNKISSTLDAEEEDIEIALSTTELDGIIDEADYDEADYDEKNVNLDDSFDVIPDEEDLIAIDDTPSSAFTYTPEEAVEQSIALSDDELGNVITDIQQEDSSYSYSHGLKEDEEIEGMPVLEAPPDMMSTEEFDLDSAFNFDREQAASALSQKISEESGLNKEELRKMIAYLDLLFDKLPEDTIREFSRSEYFDLYKKIMGELGI